MHLTFHELGCKKLNWFIQNVRNKDLFIYLCCYIVAPNS